MTCGFQSACYQPRACYPLWDESAIQEVPTGLEHYSTGRTPGLGVCEEGWRVPPLLVGLGSVFKWEVEV